jgi:hypothetical protein
LLATISIMSLRLQHKKEGSLEILDDNFVFRSSPETKID